ncbi:hypothetical protein [Streptomyces sp. KN37]|uniref:hypothetical protein n=1 Tax=Streptomyces sp. KN37 TaxID=3090667 RepID=UPI002A74C489|nr:hypothetical protein [Streptomyces sp. KN37]WPO76706.1 hypothetical protein R9806_39460 [Streptomyces sp. KN37]
MHSQETPNGRHGQYTTVAPGTTGLSGINTIRSVHRRLTDCDAPSRRHKIDGDDGASSGNAFFDEC